MLLLHALNMYEIFYKTVPTVYLKSEPTDLGSRNNTHSLNLQTDNINPRSQD
jgi:hypothetical protein